MEQHSVWMCDCPFCTQTHSSYETNTRLHLSNVGAAVTVQDTNSGNAGVDRVSYGAADVASSCNEGVSGDNT